MLIERIIGIFWLIAGLINIFTKDGNTTTGTIMIIGGYIVITLARLWERLDKITAIVIRGSKDECKNIQNG